MSADHVYRPGAVAPRAPRAAAKRPHCPAAVAWRVDPVTAAMLQEAARSSGFRGCVAAPAEGLAGLPGPVEVLFLTATDLPTLERAGAVARLVIVLLEPGSCSPELTDWARQPNRHVLFKPLQRPFLTTLFEELATEFRLRAQQTFTDGASAGPQEPFPGESLVVRRFRHRLLDLARRDVPVLVFGEPGTEKLAAARLLHRRGPRAAAPLIEVGGAGPRPPTPPRRGGDVAWWSQMLSSAQPGSLLLKDVGGLPVASQLDLCRAVALAAPNVRLLATTGSRPLPAVLANGALCGDLYRLVSRFVLHVPALRERGRDVATLAARVVAELNRRSGAGRWLDAGACEALCDYSWPGNLAELRRVLDRASANSAGCISRDDIASAVEVGQALADGESG